MHVEAEIAVTEEIAEAIAPAITQPVITTIATVAAPWTPVAPSMGGRNRKGDQSTECGGCQSKF
jgi:hypothetical protein